MAILDKMMEITARRYKRKYESLGYEFHYKKNKERNIPYIFINQRDFVMLMPDSQLKVLCECDDCHSIFEKPVCELTHTVMKHDNKVRCKACYRKFYYDNFKDEMVSKMKSTNLIRYGAELPSQTEQIKNKMKATCMERYGTEWASQNKDVIDKMRTTCIEKYGTDWACQNEDVKQKMLDTQVARYGKRYASTDESKLRKEQTCLKKYGVKCVLGAEEVKERKKKTCLEKYGVDCVLKLDSVKQKRYETNIKKYGYAVPTKSPAVQEKIHNTLYKNNVVKTSKQQIYLHQLLGGEINYPIKFYNVDIALVNEKIVIEYNGGGHDLTFRLGKMTKDEWKHKEIKRNYVIFKEGWKIITLIAEHDKLPEDNIILSVIDEAKQYLLNTKHTWAEIDLEKKFIKTSQFTHIF